MQTDAFRQWSTKIVTFTVALLAAVSAGFWAVRGWTAPETTAPPAVAVSAALSGGPQAVARALGGGKAVGSAAQAPAAAGSRYALQGIVARHGQGAALISVDGQAAKPVRVGHSVDDRLLLQSVTARSAVLASSSGGSAEITLELPLPSR